MGIKHGSLLTFECVLRYCIDHDYYIQCDLGSLCQLVLAQRDSKRPEIKLAVIKLLPLFAQYQTAKFVRLNLVDQSLSFLMAVLEDTNSSAAAAKALSTASLSATAKRAAVQHGLFRKWALFSIGRLAHIVGPKMIRSTASELKQSKAIKTLGRMLQATKSQHQLTAIIRIVADAVNTALTAKRQLAHKMKGSFNAKTKNNHDLHHHHHHQHSDRRPHSRPRPRPQFDQSQYQRPPRSRHLHGHRGHHGQYGRTPKSRRRHNDGHGLSEHDDPQFAALRRIRRFTKYPLRCLAMLAEAFKSELAPFIDGDFVATIFKLGLSRSVLRCVGSLYLFVPRFQPLIQDRLSRMTLMVLLYNADSRRSGDGDGGDAVNGVDRIESVVGGDDVAGGDPLDDAMESINEANGSVLAHSLGPHPNGLQHQFPVDVLGQTHPEALGVIPDDEMMYGAQEGAEGQHPIGGGDHGEQNMMYYHYKNSNVHALPHHGTVIGGADYFVATNHYVLGYDLLDPDAAKKAEDEIPPFVSPPMASRVNVASLSALKLPLAPYTLSMLGSARKSEDHHHHEPSSVGSGLASPLSAVDATYHVYRRRSSVQKADGAESRPTESDKGNVGGARGRSSSQSLYPQLPELTEQELRSESLIELALETMSRFKLHDVNLNLLYFVRETMLFYCNHSALHIRKQAAISSCTLLVRIIGTLALSQCGRFTV